MIPGFQYVTHACFAADRHACCGERIDVAVHCADGHFQRHGEVRGRADWTAPEQFEQGKEAVGAACHADTTLAGACMYV